MKNENTFSKFLSSEVAPLFSDEIELKLKVKSFTEIVDLFDKLNAFYSDRDKDTDMVDNGTLNQQNTSEEISSQTLNDKIKKYHYQIRIPKIQANDKKNDFSRANFSVRKSTQEYIQELSKRARMSSSLLVEYILEEYLHDGEIEKLDSQLIDLYKKAKYKENGLSENDRKDLQLNLPKYYIPLIMDTADTLSHKKRVDIDKGTLVDILIEAKLLQDIE